MKVRFEYKRAASNKTWQWTFSYRAGDFGGASEGRSVFETHHKTLNGAFDNFRKHIRDTYHVVIDRAEVLKRISPSVPIGVGLVFCPDSLRK